MIIHIGILIVALYNMANVINKGHDINSFLNELFSHDPLPQKAEYIHKEGIIITLQYIPGKGYVVGYQDTRVSSKTNPVMMFCDLAYDTRKVSTMDEFRDIIMNTPVLNKRVLAIKTDSERGLQINIRASKILLQEIIIEVIFESEFVYDKNSRTLGARPNYIKLK